MTASLHKSENSGFQLKNMSEQPLLRNRNEREDQVHLETFNNANSTTFASPEGTNSNDGTDGKNPNTTPTEIALTDENRDIQPAKDQIQNNKHRIFTSLLGGSDDDTLTAFSSYSNKKILSQSMMDIALFSANANQLRNVLRANDGHIISTISIILLVISILLQILVGIFSLLSIQYNVTNCEQRKIAFKLFNYVIVGIFLITVVNVLISAFGGPEGTGN